MHLEALTSHHPENDAISIEVLCVHKDGAITCIDSALTSEIWKARVASTSNGNRETQELQVVHASTVSIQRARQTFLGNREDLLSIFDAGRDTYTSEMVLLLTRSGGGILTFRIVAIKNTESNSHPALLSDRGMIQELAALQLPEPKSVQGKEAFFRLHTSSGSLYQGTAGNLCIYNLTTLAPRLVQTMNFPNAKGVLSYVRISPDVVATIAPDSLFLVDTRFSSFQARYGLPAPKQARAKASHHGDSMPKSPILGTAGAQLISYHSPSCSAILLLGRSLIAVDVSKTVESNSTSRKRKRNGLLIDAIGRGSIAVDESQRSRKGVAHIPRALGQLLDPYRETPEWENQRKSLDALLEKGDTLEWDLSLASALDDGTPFGNAVTETHLPDYKVDYILAKMFSTTPMEDRTNRPEDRFLSILHLQHLPETSWRRLVKTGLVTVERIEAALKRKYQMDYNHGFKHSALIQALADQDQKLATLLSMLQSPCLLKASEISYALKVAMAHCSTLGAPDGRKLLTEGEENIDPDPTSSDRMELANVVSDVGYCDVSSASENFHALLDAVLERCIACPSSLLTRSLRAELSKTELRNLINLLRIKLAQTGWLLPYTEDRASLSPHKSYPNNQLSTIGDLLGCCIDALGTGGWLLNNNMAPLESTEAALETISFMQAEISTAVASVEEATFLQGVLGEMLLCGKSALNSQASRPALAIESGNGQKAALPLGLKLEQKISLTKVGAGGELQKRTRRDIGKLKSRRVPEYSFERIPV